MGKRPLLFACHFLGLEFALVGDGIWIAVESEVDSANGIEVVELEADVERALNNPAT